MIENKFMVIPAIDIMDGQCVRLRRGVFSTPRYYGSSPLETALGFVEAGLSRLHVVDLDGARGGRSPNFRVVREICRQARCKVEVGGGIRGFDQAERWFAAGADRVCVTSMAVREPRELARGIRAFGADRFLVAADSRDGRVALGGWREMSDMCVLDFIAEMQSLGVTRFMSTAIERDGMLKGPDMTLYRRILSRFPGIDLSAGGGISRIGQIRGLRRRGLAAVVVGRALYEGVLDPRHLAAEQSGGE